MAKYWSFSFSISPSNEYSRLTSFWTDWFDLLAVQETLKSLLQQQFRSISYLMGLLIRICSIAKSCQTSATPWTVACQSALPSTISWSLLKFMPIESVMPSNYNPLLCLFLYALNLSQHEALFQWEVNTLKSVLGLEHCLAHRMHQEWWLDTSCHCSWCF